jgi:hypothetical protein
MVPNVTPASTVDALVSSLARRPTTPSALWKQAA